MATPATSESMQVDTSSMSAGGETTRSDAHSRGGGDPRSREALRQVRTTLKNMTVMDFLEAKGYTKEPVVLRSDLPIGDALKMLSDNNLLSAPVVDVRKARSSPRSPANTIQSSSP